MSDNEGITKADIDAWMERERARRATQGAGAKDLMKPAEVAALLRVDPKTVTRWAANGRIPSARTPGGHRRFYRADIMKIMNGEGTGDE